MLSPPGIMPSRRRGENGKAKTGGLAACIGKVPANQFTHLFGGIVETRVLALNPDPVFEDRALAILDENGDRIPETIPIIDPEMIRWLLERRKSEIYGNRAKAPKEPQRTGGVLVIEKAMTREEFEKRFGGSQPLADIEIEGLPPLKN